MQTINLYLHKKSIIPVLYAKQQEVGRKFQVVFADGIPDGVAFSAWYSGASGEGNYTHIGDRSAFAIDGNTVTVELITQMLNNAGDGKLCLVMSGADGSNLASWNIPYVVEHVPGMGSVTAEQYYTAFSEVIKDLPYPDVSLTAPGKAADAAAVGAALAEKNKLLWINDSPNSSFGEKAVPLDLSDVSFVAVASIYGTIILQKGQMGVWGFHDPSNVYTRAVTVTEDGVQFGECIRNGGEVANEIMVPQSIWKFAGSIPTPGEGAADDPSTNPYIQALAQLQEDVEDLKQQGGGGTDPDIHAKYFTITDDGVVSLKPEYRGASNKDNLAYSVSDMGIGVAGSKNSELPKYLVIPEVVNDRAVYSLADGIFNENEMLESVVLPGTVDKIPLSCFNLCSNLKNVFNTENIKSVGQTAFQRTSVKRVKFPALEQFGAGAFMTCGDLVYIDVGNVTDIPLYTFAFCINLNMIKSKNAIKSVGQLSLPLTANLKHAEFIQNLTSIGASAFLASGVDYDWGTLTNCTFGDDATPLQYNPTDYWSTCTYTACTNPTPTMLSQDDPRWINRQIGTTDFKYDNGCVLLCIMHAYCGLHNLHFSTVMEFEEMITSIYPECLNNFTNAYNEVDTVCRSFGLSATSYTNIDKTVLQTLYNALAEGKYAIVNFHGKTTTLGHCALAYGIDANGNLLLLDSETYHAYDKSIPSTYSLPWHKLSAGNFYGVENLVIISL